MVTLILRTVSPRDGHWEVGVKGAETLRDAGEKRTCREVQEEDRENWAKSQLNTLFCHVSTNPGWKVYQESQF